MNSILARNLMIHKQIEDIAAVLNGRGITAVLLKGAALIEAFPDYMNERVMEDIDLMLSPGDISKAREAFLSAGYEPAPEDPWAFRKEGAPAYIDIIDGLWYASAKENEEIRQRSAGYPLIRGLYQLPPEEFYAHVLAHAAIHHAFKGDKWLADLELIKAKWKLDTDALFDGTFKKYGLSRAGKAYVKGGHGGSFRRLYERLLAANIPMKGHMMRFLFLPAGKKAGYALRSLFPGDDFLKYRYGLKSGFDLFFFRFLRPLLLLRNLFRFFLNSFPARRPA
jgi:hypothetical protein